jgi:DNA-binding MarR family transcriptional regulator
MDPVQNIPLSVVHEIRDQCLCFASQRAARLLARRFDRAFAPFGITNGQFSLMVILAGKGEPRLGALAEFMAMDQTTVTAAVKALELRDLVRRRSDPEDRRARRVALTDAGRSVLAMAVPVWRAEIALLRQGYGSNQADDLLAMLRALGPAASLPPGA